MINTEKVLEERKRVHLIQISYKNFQWRIFPKSIATFCLLKRTLDWLKNVWFRKCAISQLTAERLHNKISFLNKFNSLIKQNYQKG